MPQYLSEEEVFGVNSQPQYLDPSEVFGVKPEAKRVDKGRSWAQVAGDTGIDAAKSVIGFGESAVGLADLATGNLAGQGLAAVGYDPARTQQALGDLYSDPRQQANRQVSEAKGFVDTTKALLQNPSVIMGSIVESAPMMLGGVGAVRAVAAKMLAGAGLVAGTAEAAAFLANPAVAAKLALVSGASEGALTAGNIQEQGRQAGGDYTNTAPAALAGGALTAAIGFGTSKIPGFRDAEVGMATAGMGGAQRQGLLAAGKEIAKGTFKEGVLEEMPQSAQEQVFTNLALGKPWAEGVPEAAAQGMVVGAAQGGGMNVYSAGRNAMGEVAPNPTAPAEIPVGDEPKVNQPLAPVDTAQAAINSIANEPKTNTAEKALLTPVTLTALDRVNELDTELAPVRQRLTELTSDGGGDPAFDQERLDLTAQAAALEQERVSLSKDWPNSVTGIPSSFTTEAGARVEAQYALMDAADLITSHDEGLRKNPLYPPELQPRERDRAASEMQVSGIVQKLDPARLGLSADAANGAPIVGADGLVESGNARTIALKRVYQAGGQKSEDYKQFLRANASQFGITPEAVDGMAKPVLVRVRSTPVNRAEFARQANASTVAAMAPSEQAKSDANRIDSMVDLSPDENGDFSNAASRPFIMRFMARLPQTERAGMQDADGNLSTTGYARVRNAVLAKAYGDSPVLARMTESMDDNLRNVSRAFMLAAPKVAVMREAIKDGTRFDADITPDLMSASEELARLKTDGGSVADALAQTDIMGDQRSPEARQLLQFLSDNMRRPRRMADFIGAYMDALDAAGDPNQGSLLGDTQAPTKQDLLKAAERATANETTNPGTTTQEAAQRAGGQTGQKPGDATGSSRSAEGNGADAGAATQGSAGQTSQPVSGDWVEFAPDSGAMGIPRAKMPQVKVDKRPALYDFLMAKGITHTRSFMKPGALKPTQAEYSPSKAENAKALDGQKAVVLASSDGYILDGHHRWVSRAALGDMVDVIKFNAPMGKLLEAVREFPGTTTSSESAAPAEVFAESVSATAEPKVSAEAAPLVTGDAVVWLVNGKRVSGEVVRAADSRGSVAVRTTGAEAGAGVKAGGVFNVPMEKLEALPKSVAKSEAATEGDSIEAKDAERAAAVFSRATRVDVSDPHTGISSALLELGKLDSLYQYPRSDKTDLEGIAADKSMTVGAVDRSAEDGKLWMIANTTPDDAPGVQSWIVTLPGGEHATLTNKHSKVYINVSAVGEGNGGSRVYDLAANYAFNNGLKFIGDPNGVSSAAMRRRLENMLSAAIKYGSTDFLAPHADQIEGNESIGVPALKWTDGDTLGNIRSMVDVSVASTKSTNPVATQNVRFDAATQSLRDGENNIVDAGRLSEMLGNEERARGTGQAGNTTLRRNALFKSLLQSVGNRSALMEFVHREQDSGSSNIGGTFEKSFYSRGSTSTGLSPKSVQDITDAIKSRWANAPDIVVAANMADAAIPQAVRDYDQQQKSLGATGEPEGFIHKGKVYLVADQLATPSDVIRVLFHESLGHIGLRGAFGNSLEPILRQIVAVRKAEVTAKASHYGLDMSKDADRMVAAEEVLAEMAQTKPELGFVKRAVAAIRNWLRANVPGFSGMKMTDSDVVQKFILPARAFVQRGRGGAAGAVALSRGADAKDQTDTPAFKKWFGGSKVVDADGKPLEVFHGSVSKGVSVFDTSLVTTRNKLGDTPGTYFTSKREAAAGYARAPGSKSFGEVVSAYLSIQNPLNTTAAIKRLQKSGLSFGDAKRKALEKLTAEHDGVIFDGNGANPPEYVVFKPEQIKSATGNNGDFDGSSSDIRFSRSGLGRDPAPIDPKDASPLQKAKAKALSLTSPQALDQLMYDYTDKYIDLKRIRDHIKSIGGTITDLNDAYLGEELYHKRLSKRVEDFLSDEVQPLLADLRTRGVGAEAFEEFLHARHAPEANKSMAARNPTQAEIDAGKASAQAVVKALEVQLQGAVARGAATVAIEKSLALAKEEGYKWVGAQAFKGTEVERLSLSGMTDAQAQAVMAGLTPAKLKDMNALAARVDAINAKTMDTLGQYGLMDQESLGEWRKAYQFYIPLHRDEAHPDSTSHPIGQGFSVKGDAAKRRTGSNAKVTNILGHVAMQREAALTRGEKNTVVKKLYVMAAQNPDADLWSVEGVPTITQIDKKSGFAHTYPDPMYKNKPNVVMVRIAGKDAAIVFNERNPQGVRLAGAMKNIDVGDLGTILTQTARVTRWFAAVNTQYNPVFGLVNFARDIQAAMLNLSTTPLASQQAKVAKGVPAALRAVYRVERGKAPSSPEGAKWAALWEDLQQVGGTTGYRDMYSDASDRMTALLKDLQKLDRGQVSQAAHAVVDWLSDYNDAIENGVRLSAYRAALDQGMTRERAASLAKNLTVNFNRKGAKAREIGALYAFFNAAIQGNARMFETLRGPVGKKIMFGGVALGMITSMVGMAVMGGGDGEDDEWEGIPEFVKERAIVIPLGHQDYMAIPLPLGFHVFPNFGRLLAEWAMGGPDKSLGKQVGKVLGSLVDSFNPVGGGSDIGQVVMPTVMDPLLALWRNKDWTGRPIYREDGNSMDPTPGFTRAKDAASTPGKLFAEAVNKISGGSEYRPGLFSPTPDQFDYVIGQLTGGLGRELLKVNQVITAPFTGDELPAHKVPVLGRIYGNTRGAGAQSGAFYENVRTLNEVENEVQGRNMNDDDADGYMAREPLTNLIGDGNSQEKIVSGLRKQRKQELRDEEPGYKDRVKEINTQIEEEMRVLNRAIKQVKSGVGVG